jgi:3',5'-cyclic AMP phosphodiesterase CpdA
MRVLLHLSDLHFGHVDEKLLTPLSAFARELAPDHVVVSGDLTQRARKAEFTAAQTFLAGLPGNLTVVPGNHDIPLYDVVSRFFRSLSSYRRLVSDDLAPFHADAELAILGLNTARPWRVKDGHLGASQISLLRQRFSNLDAAVTKVVVTHHPFDLPADSPHGAVVGNARDAMRAMLDSRVDIVLSGHLHVSHTAHSAHRFVMDGHSAVLVQAGTATSTRGRGEPNSFNVIRASSREIAVERVAWSDDRAAFAPVSTERFGRTDTGWRRLPN